MSDGSKETKDNKPSVELIDYGVIQGGVPLPSDWPSGDLLLKMINQSTADSTANTTNNNPKYWQTSARWAFLKKYNYLPENLQDPYVQSDEDGSRRLAFSDSDEQTIGEIWNRIQRESLSSSNDGGSSNTNDLQEFMATSKSCGRQLQWTVMEIPPALQFKLHAHPNLELVYCAKGALHEIRMSGEPFPRDEYKDKEGRLDGPDLTRLKRSWFFDTLVKGEWLVNEVGSIHKSFTSTNGNGCTLIVLWGGSHADVAPNHAPTLVNVQQAVDSMDSKLTCDCRADGGAISETFLPESERSS